MEDHWKAVGVDTEHHQVARPPHEPWGHGAGVKIYAIDLRNRGRGFSASICDAVTDDDRVSVVHSVDYRHTAGPSNSLQGRERRRAVNTVRLRCDEIGSDGSRVGNHVVGVSIVEIH